MSLKSSIQVLFFVDSAIISPSNLSSLVFGFPIRHGTILMLSHAAPKLSHLPRSLVNIKIRENDDPFDELESHSRALHILLACYHIRPLCFSDRVLSEESPVSRGDCLQIGILEINECKFRLCQAFFRLRLNSFTSLRSPQDFDPHYP